MVATLMLKSIAMNGDKTFSGEDRGRESPEPVWPTSPGLSSV